MLAFVAGAPVAAADVNSEHLFGFTEGTDLGTPFVAEAELEAIGAFGRSEGSYGAQFLTASLKYPLSEHFRVAPGIGFARFNVSGVPDFEDKIGFRSTACRLSSVGGSLLARPRSSGSP